MSRFFVPLLLGPPSWLTGLQVCELTAERVSVQACKTVECVSVQAC